MLIHYLMEICVIQCTNVLTRKTGAYTHSRKKIRNFLNCWAATAHRIPGPVAGLPLNRTMASILDLQKCIGTTSPC